MPQAHLKMGRKKIHMKPNVLANACAIYCGILIRSLTFIPELVKTCTKASVDISAEPAFLMESNDSFNAFVKLENDLRWIITARIAATINIVPGEYKIFHFDVIPSTPRMLLHVKSIAISVNYFTSGTIRVISNDPTTTM